MGSSQGGCVACDAALTSAQAVAGPLALVFVEVASRKVGVPLQVPK